MAKVWWIKREGAGRLGLMDCPDANKIDEQAQLLRQEGVDEMICLMSESEINEKALSSMGDTFSNAGIKYKQFHMPAEGTPEIDSGLDDFLQATVRELRKGKSVVLQCSNGRGRCAMIAGALMSLEGSDADAALKLLRAARHARAPEADDQENWLRGYASQAHPFAKPVPAEPWFRRVHPLVIAGAAASLIGALGTVGVLRRKRSHGFRPFGIKLP
jgi:protein-tyrosine phosphatase